MEIKIDLRSKKYKTNKNRKLIALFFTTFFSFILIFFIFHIYEVYLENGEKQKLLDGILKDNHFLKEKLADYEEIDMYLSLKEENKSGLRYIKENTITWSKYLDELFEVLPDSVTIQNYRNYYDNEVYIEGTGSSISEIALLKERLTKETNYYDVSLKTIEIEKSNNSFFYKLKSKLKEEEI